jgi:uncharacterized protein YdbL (DUF1318 family)
MTALEWLVKELSEILGPLKTEAMQDLLLVDAINKAKEMEKQQIINAWIATDNELQRIAAEQYYNETFKSE